jgi:hypothetical protein
MLAYIDIYIYSRSVNVCAYLCSILHICAYILHELTCNYVFNSHAFLGICIYVYFRHIYIDVCIICIMTHIDPYSWILFAYLCILLTHLL